MKIGTDGVLLGAWALTGRKPFRIVDVGCGSGLIAIMLAQRFNDAHIVGVEIDPLAAMDAQINVANSPWSDRIEIINADFMTYTPPFAPDAIVSNPPYFDEPIKSPDTRRNNARHQDTLNIDSLISRASSLLGNDGILSVILPAKTSDDIIYKTSINHIDITHITHVKSHPSAPSARTMYEGIKGISSQYAVDYLNIYKDNSTVYSDEYRQLTQDFYLNSTFDKS